MKEEKIRKKFPNIKNEEELKELRKMLKYKTYINLLVIVFVPIAFFLWLLLVIKTPIVGNIILIIVFMIFASYTLWLQDKYLDDDFLLKASKQTVTKRSVLNYREINKAIRKYNCTRFCIDVLLSLFVGLLCLIIFSIFGVFLQDIIYIGDDIFTLIWSVFVPLLTFVIIRISATIRKKTVKLPYIILNTKLVDKYYMDSDDYSYYFRFKCNKYGELDYEVKKRQYHQATKGTDKYYLVIVKRRFLKGYKIIKIFPAEEYELSFELENAVIRK